MLTPKERRLNLLGDELLMTDFDKERLNGAEEGAEIRSKALGAKSTSWRADEYQDPLKDEFKYFQQMYPEAVE